MTKKKSFDFKLATPKELASILMGRNPENLSSRHVRTAILRSWNELKSRGHKIRDISCLVGSTVMSHLIEVLPLSDDDLVMCLTLHEDVAKLAWKKLRRGINESAETKIRSLLFQIDSPLRREIGGQLGRARVA